MPPSLPDPSPGQPLSAGLLRQLTAGLRGVLSMRGVNGITVAWSGWIPVIRYDRPEPFWARLTARSTDDYAWTAQIRAADGRGWRDDPGGRAGTLTSLPAREINGRVVTTPRYAQLRLSEDGTHYLFDASEGNSSGGSGPGNACANPVVRMQKAGRDILVTYCDGTTELITDLCCDAGSTPGSGGSGGSGQSGGSGLACGPCGAAGWFWDAEGETWVADPTNTCGSPGYSCTAVEPSTPGTTDGEYRTTCCSPPASTQACCPSDPTPGALRVTFSNATGVYACLDGESFEIWHDPATDLEPFVGGTQTGWRHAGLEWPCFNPNTGLADNLSFDFFRCHHSAIEWQLRVNGFAAFTSTASSVTCSPFSASGTATAPGGFTGSMDWTVEA